LTQPVARAGPGPIPPGLLRALDLSVRRRVESLLAGDHRSSLLGRGTELAQVRPYVPGDDVRLIDWNVTARTQVPHVRVHVAERALTTWLLLDTSASMTFGTADRTKADVAEGVALAVSHLATRRGNRLGVLTFGGSREVVLPPRQGRAGLHGALLEARRHHEAAETGQTSIGGALRRLGTYARQRSLVVCVSDFRGPRDWRRPMLELAAHHDVLAVEVRDPREQELPDVGVLWLIDSETGRRLQVDTSRRKLRDRFAVAARAERESLAAELRSIGADHVVVTTSGDWLRPLAAFLRARSDRT
jgi:uncharacterized protein (DUF58 family)